MDQAEARTRDFFKFFMRAYPSRTVFMVLLMVAAGLAETLGVLALIPILETAEGPGNSESAIGRLILGAFSELGLSPTLGTLLLALVVAITLKAALMFVAAKEAGFTTAQVSEDLRLRLIRAFLFARWEYFGRKPIGEYSAAVNREVNRVASAYREALQLLAATLQILAYLVASWLLAWKVTLVTLVIASLLTLAFRRFFKISREAGKATTRHNLALSGRLIDVLQGMKALKAMARENLVWPFLEGETRALNQAQRIQVKASSGRQLFYEPTVTAVLAAGLFLVLEVGRQPLSEVLVLALVFYRIMQHVNTLQFRYQALLNGEGAFASLTMELARAESAQELRSPTPVPVNLSESLEARDLWFGYDGQDVLKGVNLRIKAGTFVAIMGESGSGKTTLADLFIGLHTPGSGGIFVDGVSLDSIDPGDWRRSLGYVPQEMLVFNDTILRNVTLGDESITREQAENALRAAGAWEFVQGKQGGLDHEIGDRGSTLSGGQRQRIAIARAMVWDPSVLILDEVTTALDPETERGICDTLRKLRGRTTILAISHQPAIQEAAEVAYRLEDGKLNLVAG